MTGTDAQQAFGSAPGRPRTSTFASVTAAGLMLLLPLQFPIGLLGSGVFAVVVLAQVVLVWSAAVLVWLRGLIAPAALAVATMLIMTAMFLGNREAVGPATYAAGLAGGVVALAGVVRTSRSRARAASTHL